MKYPIIFQSQMNAVLRALRKSKGLSQTQLGDLIGVNQKRIARIEKNAGKTNLDQISRIISVLGARLVVEEKKALGDDEPNPVKTSMQDLKHRNLKRASSEGTW